MNRAVLVAAAALIVIAVGILSMRRAPQPEAEPAPPAAAPRIVPRKNAPVPTRATPVPDAARKPATKEPPKTPPVPVAPPAPTLASLRLVTDVPGASVFIDRQFVGNTPLTLDELEPGTRRVQITADGFESVQRTLDLKPGPNSITIRVKEVRLSARAGVVHKHGIGNCEGQLTATLDGIRYDTGNKGDAFALSYAQLETFSVDYLQKNLRVKQKGGKTWNFTDKSGNADVLFVFHRDVEAARKKLAEGYARAQ